MDLFPSSGYISLSHISSLTYAVNCCLNRSAGYFASTMDVVSGLPTIPLYRLAMPNPDDVRALWMEVMGYKLMFTMWTSVYGTKWKLTSEILTRKKIHSTKHILSLNFNGRLELWPQPLWHCALLVYQWPWPVWWTTRSNLTLQPQIKTLTHSKRKSGWRTYLHHSTEQTACCGPAAICSFTWWTASFESVL